MTASEELLLGAGATIVVVLALLLALFRGVSSSGSPARRPAPGRAGETLSPGAPAIPAGRLPESRPFLDVVLDLQRTGALWPELMQRLNPAAEARINADLQVLRGAHLFAPHLALNILEAACREHPKAPAGDIVAAARRSAEQVVRFGD